MPDGAYARPLPRINRLSRPFWEGAKRHELMLQRCVGCGRHRFPPSERCAECLAVGCGVLGAARAQEGVNALERARQHGALDPCLREPRIAHRDVLVPRRRQAPARVRSRREIGQDRGRNGIAHRPRDATPGDPRVSDTDAIANLISRIDVVRRTAALELPGLFAVAEGEIAAFKVRVAYRAFDLHRARSVFWVSQLVS